jgi:carbonyl reductase 1
MYRKKIGMEAVAQLGPKTEFAQLDIADKASIDAFVSHMENNVKRCDGLINNAAIAFKGSDPTPFKDQAAATLNINYFGTADLTDKLIPLLRSTGEDPFITTVASMAGKIAQIKGDELREKFLADTLTRDELDGLVNKFISDVQNGNHLEEGWGNSNYGFSKLAIIAYCRLRAREETESAASGNNSNKMIKINWCCPGYCKTDMASHMGPRPPEEGAKNAVMLSPPGESHGVFIQDYAPSEW